MRLPATHFAGNLMWTRQGTVYATWALTALPTGKSDDDLQLVAEAHSAFYRSLAGRQVLLRGTLVWTDPVAVVARMIEDLDLTGLDSWAQECEQTIDTVAGLPLGSRLWTLTVPLGVADWKQKARTLTRAATTELCDQLRIPGLRPPDTEIDYYRQAAATLASTWPSPFGHRPATVAEQLWLLRYAQSRGAEALANPFDVPIGSDSGQTLTSRAGVGEPLLDPAGMTDVDDPKKIRAAAPLRRRWLKTVTDTGTTSYQAGLVLADVPAGGMETPGGEFLGRLDELGVPVDIGIRMTVRTRAEGLRRNKRGFTMLNDQADQIDGSPDVASLSAGLQEAARQLIEYNQRLSINTKEVEIEPVVMVSVAAATPEAADQLALDFVQAPGNKEFTWARPVGAEEDIFWAMQPGGRLSMQLNDYRHITTGADFAAAAPMMTSRLGARKGSLLGLNTTTPLLSTVHLDLAGEAERNFSPSIAYVAELGGGKALALDTPIPTPSGWTVMGDLAPGDQVFDEQGRPTTVEWTSPVMRDHPCYEVVFSDGSSIVADAEHAWTTLPDRVRSGPAKRNFVARRAGTQPEDLDAWAGTLTGPSWPEHAATITTEQIAATLRRGIQANHAIPVAGPLDLPEADLPIDPYVFGAWLGDGTSSASHLTSADPELLTYVESAGYTVTALSNRYLYAVALPSQSTTSPGAIEVPPCAFCGRAMTSRYRHRTYCSRQCARDGRRAGLPPARRGICDGCGRELLLNSTGRRCSTCWHASTLRGRLRLLGVLRNKHIPTRYLRASRRQRHALLAGLLDTDGTVSPGGAVQICLTRRQLAIDTHELACSLGYRANLCTGRATLNGRDCGPKWTISFTTTDQVFRLTRKQTVHQDRTAHSKPVRHRLRYIVDVRKIASVPVRCIRVAAPNRLFLAGRTMVPTHNSYSMKKNCGDEIDRGAVGIAIDGSVTREWATFARSLDDKQVAIADVEHPEVSVDPLRVLPLHRAGPVLLSFLVKLCDFSATSTEGITLAKVLKPTYLQARGIGSSAQLLTHLSTDCEYGNAQAIADKIAVFADPDTAGALADIVFTEDLPPLDLAAADMTVFGTHGVKLPTQAELESAHRYNRLGVDKLFGQAFYLLIANYAHEVCFSDRSRPAVFAVDETWRVTLSEEGAAIVLEFIRDGRKVKAIILLGSHDPEVDFGGETLSGLIGNKIVMRQRNRRLAEKCVAWLGFDPAVRIDLVERVQTLSPQDRDGVVPPERRGEAVLVDAMGQFGDLKILPPARRERAEAISSTPPSRTPA